MEVWVKLLFPPPRRLPSEGGSGGCLGLAKRLPAKTQWVVRREEPLIAFKDPPPPPPGSHSLVATEEAHGGGVCVC